MYSTYDVRWDSLNIRGIDGYVTYNRIDKNTVPHYFKFWELGDDNDCIPYRYKKDVLVNFFGTFITKGDLPIDDESNMTGYINEDEYYYTRQMSLTFEEIIKLEEKELMTIEEIDYGSLKSYVWYHIPGFNGYQINGEGIVRSMKMMHKNPGHILSKDKSGKYILTNNENERVRISSEELMRITFSSDELIPAMQDDVYMGGRNKVFTKGKVKKDNTKYKVDLYSKVMKE